MRSTRRAAPRSRPHPVPAILLAAVVLATTVAVVGPRAANAATVASVSGSGTVQVSPFWTRTFSVDVTRDDTGTVSGTLSIDGSTASVGCLTVSGSDAVVGGGFFDGFQTRYLTLTVHDGGPGGLSDLVDLGGPSGPPPPDCSPGSTPTPTLELSSGDVTVTGPGGSGGDGSLVSVAANGSVLRGPTGSGQADSFWFVAIEDGTGIRGQARFNSVSGQIAWGSISCFRHDGPAIVIGIRHVEAGFPDKYATIWATDGGDADTIAFDGPTYDAPADCDAPSPPQDPLWYGQVTVRDGPSEAGTVSGSGTDDMGAGYSRTFEFDAERTATGAVSGTFSIAETYPFGSFSISGTVDCLDIRDGTALLLVTGTSPTAGTLSGAIFLRDGGPAGSGDTISVSGWNGTTFECLTAQESPSIPIASGDISITGDGGPDPSVTPEPTVDPYSGRLGMTALREQGGTLAGVSYTVTGSNGLVTTIADGDQNDGNAEPGTVELIGLELGHTYTACVEDTPPEWYAVGSVCWPQTLTEAQPIAGSAFDFRFVADLTIDTSRPDSGATPRYGVYEKTFTLNRAYDLDVFDSRRIDISATFEAPSGAEITVPAFWTQDFIVRAGTGVGTSEVYDIEPGATLPGVWRIRFSPDEVGTYSYTIRADDKRQPGAMVVTSPELAFEATASADPGPIEVDPRDPRFLRHRDGSPYQPLGHDAAFEDGNPFIDGTHYYTEILDSFEAAGEDWTRIWMTDFNRSALEWSTGHWSGFYTGIGQYSLRSAWRMDEILELAAERGIQVQLVLNDHGQFSTYVNARWSENPYSSARGGPVPAADPGQFFTNAEAKRLFKQRLRYLVARYGAYRNVLAWELFNEVQFVGTAAKNAGNDAALGAAVTAWHAEMAAYLASIDPYDHLITSSSEPFGPLEATWSDPNLDLVQVHDYGPNATRDERFHDTVVDLQARSGKPVLIAEFGLGDGVQECGFDPTTSTLPAADVEHLVAGTHLHNGAWTAALSGSMAASWWWGCYIHSSAAAHRTAPDFPLNERVFPALRAYLAGEDLAALGLEAADITAPSSVRAFGLENGSRALVWVRDALDHFGSGARPGDLAGRSLTGVTLELDGFLDGTYDVDVWSTYGSGGLTSTFVATAAAGVLAVPLPAFTRDVALKIAPGGESPAVQVPAGGTVSTDAEGDGATADDPLETAVTTPVAGVVTLSEAAGGTPPTGYGLVGQTVLISAPSATAADPLRIVMRLDASAVPMGDDETTLTVFRNGVPVPACTGAAGTASPDPCVALRERLADDDVRITVLSSAASAWAIGVPGPTVGAITSTAPLVPIGTTVSMASSVTDSGALGGHVATWTWGDGTTSAGTVGGASGGSAPVTGSHAYTAPGVYAVTLEVVDPSGQSASATFRYVVVYDPTAGFATGGGWIVPGGVSSDGGDLLPGLDGASPADFGFVVKYKKGASSVPGGSLTFVYEAGDFGLSASSFEWLVVTNSNWATFQGLATVDGAEGLYPFRVEARDGEKSGQPDRFILKLWAPGANPDTDEPIYKASGDVHGQVTIHRPK